MDIDDNLDMHSQWRKRQYLGPESHCVRFSKVLAHHVVVEQLYCFVEHCRRQHVRLAPLLLSRVPLTWTPPQSGLHSLLSQAKRLPDSSRFLPDHLYLGRSHRCRGCICLVQDLWWYVLRPYPPKPPTNLQLFDRIRLGSRRHHGFLGWPCRSCCSILRRCIMGHCSNLRQHVRNRHLWCQRPDQPVSEMVQYRARHYLHNHRRWLGHGSLEDPTQC